MSYIFDSYRAYYGYLRDERRREEAALRDAELKQQQRERANEERIKRLEEEKRETKEKREKEKAVNRVDEKNNLVFLFNNNKITKLIHKQKINNGVGGVLTITGISGFKISISKQKI